mgnify:CR=1 FL=1
MKIILATAIYPPAIGGPAEYVKNLAGKLTERGLDVAVVAYGEKQAGKENFKVEFVAPKSFFRHIFYFLKLFFISRGADIIYAFDPLAAGLPAYLTAKLRGIKFVMRVGGDYLWERDVEAGRVWTTLRAYYEYELCKKRTVEHKLLKTVFGGVHKFIFTTKFQAEIYTRVFGIPKDKISIIQNPFASAGLMGMRTGNKNIIFAGRFIKLKNLDNLILAFKNIVADFPEHKLVLIGEGPEESRLISLISEHSLEDRVLIWPKMPKEKLSAEISAATACVLPSLSEVSPNFALECISIGTPIVLTREHGLDIALKEEYLIDPMNQQDIENKLRAVLTMSEKSPGVFGQPSGITFDDIVKKHLEIFNQ